MSIDVALRRIAVALIAVSGCSQGADHAAVHDASTEPTSIQDAGACTPVVVDGAIYDDAGARCADFRRLPCGLPPDADLRNCLPSYAACTDICGGSVIFGCQLMDASCDDGGLRVDADVSVECIRCFNGGRRPRGLSVRRGSPAASPLGAYFAELAQLEAASVTAFDDLERALGRLGAPRGLRLAARRAARDERRHTAIARRLARRFGARAGRPHVARTPDVTLAELLADNVAEGCIAESYGALVAVWQAERAEDPEIARALRVIAKDELRHATLGWDVLAWGAPRADGAPLRQVARRALERARRDVDRPVDPDVSRATGHPPRQIARKLFGAFEELVAGQLARHLGAPT